MDLHRKIPVFQANLAYIRYGETVSRDGFPGKSKAFSKANLAAIFVKTKDLEPKMVVTDYDNISSL